MRGRQFVMPQEGDTQMQGLVGVQQWQWRQVL
jgi:hypothetical protein